jgi:hypothetical protein
MSQWYLEKLVAACVVTVDFEDFALQNIHDHTSGRVIILVIDVLQRYIKVLKLWGAGHDYITICI